MSDTAAVLLAVLMNPPLTTGERTRRQLAVSQKLLACETLVVENLFPLPSRSISDISSLGIDELPWLEARIPLREAISGASRILLGYGMTVPTGAARLHHLDQLSWLRSTMIELGHATAWQLGDGARHPSRWHQYISDRHGRTNGGTSEDRLREALTQVPIAVR